MFIEHRTYQIQAGRIGEYLQGLGEEGVELQRRHLGPCLGHYTTEAGPLGQVIALWRNESFEARLENRQRLYAEKAWRDIIARVSPLVSHIETKLLVPSSVWDGEYPR